MINLINYIIEKKFFKIRPALEIINNELYYSMILNKYKLYKSVNERYIKPNSLIEITKNTDFEVLFNNIIKARDSFGYKTCLFLISFTLSEEILNKKFGDEIVKFLRKLKRRKIFFVITKPACRHWFGYYHNKISNEFKIPKGLLDSIELFKLDGKHAILINNETIELKEETRRVDIYNKYKESKKQELPFEKCRHCIYRIRNECEIQ
jgi:hypothetical protein